MISLVTVRNVFYLSIRLFFFHKKKTCTCLNWTYCSSTNWTRPSWRSKRSSRKILNCSRPHRSCKIIFFFFAFEMSYIRVCVCQHFKTGHYMEHYVHRATNMITQEKIHELEDKLLKSKDDMIDLQKNLVEVCAISTHTHTHKYWFQLKSMLFFYLIDWSKQSQQVIQLNKQLKDKNDELTAKQEKYPILCKWQSSMSYNTYTRTRTFHKEYSTWSWTVWIWTKNWQTSK